MKRSQKAESRPSDAPILHRTELDVKEKNHMTSKIPKIFHQHPQILYDTREGTNADGLIAYHFIRPEYQPMSEQDKRSENQKPEADDDCRRTFRQGDMGIAHYSGVEPLARRRIIWVRKSHSDFRGSIGGGRERLVAELERLRLYQYRAIMVACSREEIYDMPPAQQARMKPGQRTLTRSQIDGTILSFEVNFGIAVRFCGSEQGIAERIMAEADIFWNRECKYARYLMPKRGEEARP